MTLFEFGILVFRFLIMASAFQDNLLGTAFRVIEGFQPKADGLLGILFFDCSWVNGLFRVTIG
jgi:hypothetical protein